jgi:hypothetical protein
MIFLATMRVYQDFFNYESGIYVHSPLFECYQSGYHSVRIIGWGEEPSPINGRSMKFWVSALYKLENDYLLYFTYCKTCESYIFSVWRILGDVNGERTDSSEFFEAQTNAKSNLLSSASGQRQFRNNSFCIKSSCIYFSDTHSISVIDFSSGMKGAYCFKDYSYNFIYTISLSVF